MYDILKQIDQLPSETTGKTLTDYSDTDQIAKWAKGNANRALIAQVLYDLLTK